MAALLARKASWLAFLAGSSLVDARSAFWTYTARVQDCIVPLTFYDGEVTSSTSLCEIKKTASPTVTPIAARTSSYNTNLDYVSMHYPVGAVASSDLVDPYDYTSSAYTYIVYSMEVTYTAPASCATPFTVVANASVTVPALVSDQVTPTAVITSKPTYAYYDDTYETWYLGPGAAPWTSSRDLTQKLYVTSCSMPPAQGTASQTSEYGSYYTGSGSGGYRGGSSSDYYSSYCYSYYGCTSWKTWVIIIAVTIPGIFLLGFLESYFWFRRLMLGKGCLRLGTVLWICMSLWVACFTRTQSRRSAEDQKLLREKWKNTSFGTALKLWFRWGFRHRYPVPLLGQYSRNTVGIVPEGQPLPVPGMAQNGVAPGGPQPPPGAYNPNAGPIMVNGQYYYPAPQTWAPAPNGQGYPAAPGQAYAPGAYGVPQYYGEQSKEAPSVTTTSVSPAPSNTQPVPPATTNTQPVPPSPVSPVTIPRELPQVSEAPTSLQPPSDSAAAAQKPT